MSRIIVESSDIEKELKRATKLYEDFHWGRKVDKTYYSEIPDPPKVVFDLGYLRAVIYETIKGEDKKSLFYIHAFGRTFPILSGDATQRHLFISGGNFKVTKEGIEG